MGKVADPLKIALVVYTWSETLGGVERYVFDLARGLLRRGHEVHVFCRRRDGAMPGVQFHDVPGSASGSQKYNNFARDSAKAVDLAAFDVVHGFGRTFAQDLLRVGGGCHEEYLRQTRGKMPGPIWLFFHPKDRALMRLERDVFARRSWRRLVCISRRVADEVARIHGVKREEAIVIHNGTDVEAFHPRNRRPAEGPVRILFVGSGFQRKGLEQAIRALARVKGDWTFRVVGRGHTSYPAALASHLGIFSRVTFDGGQTEMPRIYGEADLLLFPTLYDAFGTVTLEAMATGIPVVVSRQAGSSEVVDDGVDGRIVEDPRDEGELAGAIEGLVGDRALRERLGGTARSKAEANSIDANIEKVIGVYRDIAKEKGRG